MQVVVVVGALAFVGAGLPAYAQDSDASAPATQPAPDAAPAAQPDAAENAGLAAEDAATEVVLPAPRAWHVWLATGGVLALFGPEPGLWAGAALSRGRWGVRTDGFVFGRGDDADFLAAGSITYELGRTRRHLVMTARGGAGVRFPDAVPVLLVGLGTQLGLMKRGPLVLGLDVGFHVDLGDLPLDTYLVSMLALGLSW